MEEITPLVTGVKSYIYHRVGEITPLVTGLKSSIYIYHRLGEIAPLVTGVKSYIYLSPTGRNYAVSYWRKILHIYIYITNWEKLRR